jgi:CheY-like chemotaxis protein
MSLETILLVHEDACIRSVVRAVLQHLGYQIFEASGEDEAMNVALTPKFTIDLLLTDVDMELADHLKELQPDIKVLCIADSARETAECRAPERRYAVIPKPLKPQLLASKIRELLDEPGSRSGSKFNCPLPYRLKNLDPSHPYFGRHGITKETAQHFGAGFFAGPGRLTGRIAIPIHDEGGELIAYAGYSLDDSAPKRKYWPEFNTSEVLFNYRPPRWLITEFALTVVVVDGFLDCMKVHQAGFPSVVSLTGPSLSEVQGRMLTESFYSIALLLNGPEVTHRIAARLMQESFVRVLADPAGRPPYHLSADEIRRLMCGLAGFGRSGSDEAWPAGAS